MAMLDRNSQDISDKNEFFNVHWKDSRLESVWMPRIRSIRKVWRELEVMSVVAGLRSAAFISGSGEKVLEINARIAGTGLVIVPLYENAAVGPTYRSRSSEARKGHPIIFRCAVSMPSNCERLAVALENNNDNKVGELLGFPLCCRRFFDTFWTKNQLIDPTWDMARQPGLSGGAVTKKIDGPAEANILLRGLGVRPVFHLPCHFGCKESVDIGLSLATLGVSMGYTVEMDWLAQLLSLPVDWTSIGDIATLQTDLFTIRMSTDWTDRPLHLSWTKA